MAGKTQKTLYSEIALDLSWSESELPQVQRTKHVHALHPYLGKFIPQLVDVFLERYFSPRDCLYDPFVGSGTTLVEANAFGASAIGCDISAFNCLLARVTTHFDLDFPRTPIRKSYWCHKHRRTCSPVREASKFLRRYTTDTVRRIRAFSNIRTAASVKVIHDDARFVDIEADVQGIITSPPYPGLIDYHEQHRYAYELLGLQDLREHEIGAAKTGTSRRAIEDYVSGIAAVFRNARRFMASGAPVVIIVNDSRNLYPSILDEAGLILEDRLKRHVNRRTGRRAGEFFEDVLVCRSR